MLDAVVGAAAVQSISVETVLGGGRPKERKIEPMAGEKRLAQPQVVALQRGVTSIHGGFEKEQHATARI
jgi:hypothetical protein